MAKILTIDIHTHILPEHIPNWKEKFGYGGFVQLQHHKPCCANMILDDGKFFREIEDNCWSAEKRIDECDHHHVDVQVLSTVPVMFSYWAKPEDCLELSIFLNDQRIKLWPCPILQVAGKPFQLKWKSLTPC